jgi:hypothetical protein
MNDPSIDALVRQVQADNRRIKHAGIGVLVLLGAVFLPAWVAQDPDAEPAVVAVQQVLRTHRLELIDASGKVVAVLQAVDDKRDDVVVGYHPNGVRAFEAHMKDGRYHGPYRQWTQTGIRIVEGVYLDGLSHGLWGYYFDNQGGPSVRRRGNFQKGRKVGRWETWHANGQKASEGEYDENNQQTGEWQVWKEDGTVDEALSGRYVKGNRVE